MNLYYEIIHSKAVSQCNTVSDALEKCEKSLYLINRQIDGVSSSWTGDSGMAMLEQLYASKTQLQGVIDNLKRIIPQMRTEAENVYTILQRIHERQATEGNNE